MTEVTRSDITLSVYPRNSLVADVLGILVTVPVDPIQDRLVRGLFQAVSRDSEQALSRYFNLKAQDVGVAPQQNFNIILNQSEFDEGENHAVKDFARAVSGSHNVLVAHFPSNLAPVLSPVTEYGEMICDQGALVFSDPFMLVHAYPKGKPEPDNIDFNHPSEDQIAWLGGLQHFDNSSSKMAKLNASAYYSGQKLRL